MSRISPFQSGRQMHSFVRAAAGDDLLNALAIAETRERELAGALRYDPWKHDVRQTVSPIPEDPNYRVPLGPWGSRSRFAHLMGSNAGDPQIVSSAGAGAHRLPPSVEGRDLTAMEEAALAHLNPPEPVSKAPVLKQPATVKPVQVADDFDGWVDDPQVSMADLAAMDGDNIDIPPIFYDDEPAFIPSLQQPFTTVQPTQQQLSTPRPQLRFNPTPSRTQAPYNSTGVSFSQQPPTPLQPSPVLPHSNTGVSTANVANNFSTSQQPFIPTQTRVAQPYSNIGVGQTNTVSSSSSSSPSPAQGWAQQAWEGLKRGMQWGVGEGGGYARSAFTERAPETEYQDLGGIGQGAYATGRAAADAVGHGTRKFLWNVHPEDVVGTYGKKFLESQGVPRVAQLAGSYGASVALGVGSGNFNPLNPLEGGRPLGYQANNPDEDDPRKSNSPVYDMVIERGLLGRRGKLLPWEQFHAERPDVSYETYAGYQDYQRNKDPSLLSKATLGLVKGTMDGINGPELSVMGYGVTPLGAAAALGTLAATAYGAKRMATLRP